MQAAPFTFLIGGNVKRRCTAASTNQACLCLARGTGAGVINPSLYRIATVQGQTAQPVQRVHGGGLPETDSFAPLQSTFHRQGRLATIG